MEFLAIHCAAMQLADLGILRRIPFVDLHFEQETILVLSAGSWQSLETHGQKGFHIDFRDIDAFVQDINRFLFKGGSESMYSLILEANKRQKLPCLCRRQCRDFSSGDGIDCLSTTEHVFYREYGTGPNQDLAPLYAGAWSLRKPSGPRRTGTSKYLKSRLHCRVISLDFCCIV